jgi:predicted ArsR family transcriptional regulator
MKKHPEQREATPEEFKAMAHPLRLRILRLCLHEALTNKQIADHLQMNPATVLHHVRLLAETGFLEVDEVRSGARGALEKPYRATGKSWTLSVSREEDLIARLVVVDALRGELDEAGPDDMLVLARMGLKLSQAAIAELEDRLEAIIRELSETDDDPDGDTYGFFVALHRRPSPQVKG